MAFDILGSPPSLVMTLLAALGVTRLALRRLPRRMKQSELRRRLRRLLQENRTS